MMVSGQRIGAGTVFWAAGVMASPAAAWLNAEADSAGQVKVAPDLTVPGLANVFAVGDTALVNAWDGRPVPGLPRRQAARHVCREGHSGENRVGLRHRRSEYQHVGNLATIGRKSAVVDFGWIRFGGALAWWFWGLAHAYLFPEWICANACPWQWNGFGLI
ncbi:MAG: hypothetical protein R3F37_12525 [Candidatus Competibacteraceae bacterium]